MRPSIIIHSDKRLLGVIEAQCRVADLQVILYDQNDAVMDYLKQKNLPFKTLNDFVSDALLARANAGCQAVSACLAQGFASRQLLAEFDAAFECQPALRTEVQEFLQSFFTSQVNLIEVLTHIFTCTQVRLVVTLDDWPGYFQALVRVAKAQGVKVLTICHGVIGIELGRKFISDYYAVYAERDRAIFTMMQWAKAENIFIVGNPAWDKYSNLAMQPQYSVLSEEISSTLSRNKKTIVFLSTYGLNSFVVSAIEMRYRAFLQAVKVLLPRFDMQVIIKIHPYGSLDYHWHKTILTEYGLDLPIFSAYLEGWLNACDFVVSPGFSSTLIEAALLNKPGIFITGIKYDPGVSLYAKDCFWVVDDNALAAEVALLDFLHEGAQYQEMRRRIPYTVERFATNCDGHSALRVQKLVKTLAGSEDSAAQRNLRIQLFMYCSAAELPQLADSIETLSAGNPLLWRLNIFSDMASPDPMFDNSELLSWHTVQQDAVYPAIYRCIEQSEPGWVFFMLPGSQFEPDCFSTLAELQSHGINADIILTGYQTFNDQGELLPVTQVADGGGIASVAQQACSLFVRSSLAMEILSGLRGHPYAILAIRNVLRRKVDVYNTQPIRRVLYYLHADQVS